MILVAPIRQPIDRAWWEAGVIDGLPMRDVLAERNIGAVFRFLHSRGWSWGAIAQATDIGEQRIREVAGNKRRVESYDVYLRVATGLSIPRGYLGVGLDEGATGGSPASGAIHETTTYASQAAAGPDIRQAVKTANRLDILAVRGLGLFAMNDALLRPALIEGRTEPLVVRALIMSPDGPAAVQRAAEIGESVEAFSTAIHLAQHKLADLAKKDGIELSAYRYATLPVWRLISVDETMFVSTFDEEWEGHASPVHRLESSGGGALYRGFRRAFDGLISTSEQFI